MELQYLRAFLVAAREGNFTRAGERLFTAQSNISTAIRNLERELDVALFLRSKNGVRLTKKGEEFLLLATKIMDLVDEAAQFNRPNGPPRGRLTIGSMESTAVVRLSPVIAKFIRRNPDVHLDLRTSDTAVQRESLLRGDLDCAFFGEEADDGALESFPVFQEELVLAVPGAVKARGFQDLAGGDFLVLQRGCSYRKRLEAILWKRGIKDAVFHEVSGIHTQLACVNAGMGAGLFPRSFLLYHKTHGLRVLDLPASDSRQGTCMVWRKDRFLSPALRAFIEFTKALRKG